MIELISAVAAPIATVLATSVPVVLTLVLSRKPVKTKPETVDVGEGEEPFRGSRNDMVGLMWRDFKELNLRLNKSERAAERAEAAASAAREIAEEAREETREIREQYGDLVGAIRRYLQKIANAWHSRADTPFPPPDDVDFDILQHALPKEHTTRRST